MGKISRWTLADDGVCIYDDDGMVAEFGFGLEGNNARENARAEVAIHNALVDAGITSAGDAIELIRKANQHSPA